MSERPQLAVLGRPIGHSKSPLLHAAAYRVLGLDWEYRAVDLGADELSDFIGELGPEWRGLSLTMPHKQVVMPILDETEPLAAQVGAANTVRFTDDHIHGFNTDVEGIVRALGTSGIETAESVAILGAGSTARSAIAAAARIGAHSVTVLARDASKVAGLESLTESFGVVLASDSLDDPEVRDASVVISTLPSGVADPLAFPDDVRAHTTLLDVAYAPWPSAIAQSWTAAGGTVVSGLEMLFAQALSQVRIFVNGNPHLPLEREDEVANAMRQAVGLAV